MKWIVLKTVGSTWMTAAGLAALVWLAALLPAAPALAFGFNDVAAQAKQLAAKSYRKPDSDLPKSLQNLHYDQYRDIRFQQEKALWRDSKLPFEVAFFHPGMLYTTPVKIHEVVGKRVQEIQFDPGLFNYGKVPVNPKEMSKLGFAGFRVHFPVNKQQYKDEVLVFLGASYFRALGKGQLYGLSARGLAVDTALHSGEEFPQFVQFWLVRPQSAAREMTIYALLDSPRVTGAYQFILRPGVSTAIDVKSRLYLRENVSKLGLAPLTSMYFFGENQRSATEDYRPEVHDSDGLSIQMGTGEWIWRPLVNPKRLLLTSFAATNPLGFGLMQRDREFSSYQDLEARYEARPSAWVEPKGKWGSGRVELIQIPTPNETNDNIVAFWVPDSMPAVGAPFDLQYRLLWQRQNEQRPELAWVAQSRRGHGYVAKADDSIALFVDFEGPALEKLPADSKVEPVVTTDANAKLVELNAYKNDVTGGYRMAIKVRRLDNNKPVELRGFLTNNKTTLSETWSYILPAE